MKATQATLLLLVLALWLSLVYNILQTIKATDVMWLLYYAYVPLSIVAHTLNGVISKEQK